MALINCPFCGKQISDKAVNCPHCGKYIFKTNTPTKLFRFHAKWICAPLIVCVLWGLYFARVFPFDSFYHQFGNGGDADTYTHIGLLVSSVILAILLVILESNHVRIAVKMLFFSVVAVSLTLLAFKVEEEWHPKEEWHQFEKGLYYETNNDIEKAEVWYHNAAANGHAEACFRLGWLFDKEQNYKTALLWYLRVPQCKYPDSKSVACAYNNIGVMYQKGNGVEKDLQKAMEYFQMALKTTENNASMFEDEYGLKMIDKIKEHINELEEISLNNLSTMDLSALMLHGKVKSVEESLGGNACTVYKFTESGDLENINQDNYRGKSWHRNKELVISFENTDDEYGGWAYSYTVDDKGRLVKSMYSSGDFAEEVNYSNYNSNGWPTRSKTVAEFGGDVTICSLNYSQIDEHGNWTQQHSVDDSGNESDVYRSIEYYK